MTSPLPGNTSGTARLMTGAPSYAVGWQTPVYVPNPAAGQVWSYTVDGRYYERLVSVFFAFAASAVVANRLITMQLLDTNGDLILEVQCGGEVTAGSFLNVSLTNDGPAYDTGAAGHSYGYVPGFMVPPGWQWAVTVAGMDVGDQLTGIVLQVQRFPSDAVEITAGQ